MATRGFQDENRHVHYGGASFDKETNDYTTVRKPGLSASKPLSNITNSGKQSNVKLLKNNFPTKASDVGVYEGPSVPRQKAPLGSRRALADISNSKKSAPHRTSFLRQSNVPDIPNKTGSVGRKALVDISNTNKSSQGIKTTCSKKLDKIVEEQFLHNHQYCVDTGRRGLDVMSFYTILGFNDHFSVELGTPLPKSNEPKVDSNYSPPKYMEYEEVPEFLNEPQFRPHCRTRDTSPCRPFPSGYSSPDFKLCMSP